MAIYKWQKQVFLYFLLFYFKNFSELKNTGNSKKNSLKSLALHYYLGGKKQTNKKNSKGSTEGQNTMYWESINATATTVGGKNADNEALDSGKTSG